MSSGLVVTAVLVLALIVVTFVVGALRKRFDTIDTVWGLGFALVAVVTFARSDGDLTARILSTVLTVVWGVRLAVHIGLRNRGGDEDKRYQGRGPLAMFTRFYLTQAVLLWLISLPVQVAQYGDPAPAALYWIGGLLWAVGFAFEAIGDHQLQRFRRDPANKGKVLDTGLWRYTRHPNYFGDACVWWGLYLLACHSWLAAATVVSPLIMTALLAKGSGKPILERQLLDSRPGYAEYVARTSGFFPLPPKPLADR
ncbi:DUF1295 domain-containing protein [Amycolatopsis sp. K13G38]|uniref:DUF1295 domain-containing protein n=1 Tax=Amycolatopsis acididurans TaxID=2724524 RepID=A0ABX1JFQ7_9PSEU|nr:DUF1295 domain-containing protein [Amycolatopsis acididurans]NKQ58589.1 DUF1295 domain-containing protein [Amycolatopsis acididurans]